MDNTDDSENTAKVSDSAYSNSCSNSQSRRSHSSKSTHSGSNSSGSSGYGGKPSTSGFSINTQSQPSEKRSKEKDAKKKIPMQSVQTELQATEVQIETELPVTVPSMMETSTEIIEIVARSPTPALAQTEVAPESIEVCDRSSGKDEPSQSISPVVNPVASAHVGSSPISSPSPDGFACVISMKDGVVMYATSSITTALGFPKDMWIGRSFIDFVHQRDRNTFASQISSGLAAPKNLDAAPVLGEHVSTMLCRIRRYKSLNNGFSVKDKVVKFMPFALKLFFTNIKEEEQGVIYLVIQATPLFSAFKIPNEVLVNPVPFVIRHSPSGKLDYIDQESVPYLGYLPQDIVEQDALQLYHISDLMYLRLVYETVVKEGGLHRSEPYRMMVQNGDYLKLETEWSSFTNPWSRKLEFVIGKHYILQGPANPDVFQTPEPEKVTYASKEEEAKAQLIREHMVRIMNEVLTKPAEVAKQQMSKRCQDLATFVESLMDDTPVPQDELRVEIQDADYSYFEHDSVLLGGISPHHDYNDSDTSTETPLSYNQLNYNENLQRYFDSHIPFNNDENNTLAICDFAHTTHSQEIAASSSLCSSLRNTSIESNERESNSDSSTIALVSTSRAGTSRGFQALRLTESRLKKHNAEMEKELLKMHRGSRSSKSEREKLTNENKQMTREHLARCNAVYQPTTASFSTESQPHGVKRASKQVEKSTTAKHRCSSPRLPRRDSGQKFTNNAPMPSAGNNVPSPWPSAPQVNNMNGFILGLGIPQPITAISPIAVVPGVIPMYYAPTFAHPLPPGSDVPASTSHSHYHRYSNTNNINPFNMNQGQMNESNLVFQINSVTPATMNATRTNPYTMPSNQNQPLHQNHQMQCMMLGQPLYGAPFLYSAINPQMSLTLQNSFMPRTTPVTQLSGSSRPTFEEQSGDSSSNEKRKSPLDNSDGTNDKTDGESSYSSFYSSFFKTNSSNNEDSDSKTKYNKKSSSKSGYNTSPSTSLNCFAANRTYTANERRGPIKNMEPPRLQKVGVTSELTYKYQIAAKNVDEVLSNDLEKLKTLKQPALVNEQLDQLYLDLQLQGVASRLTLEEGITSSSSSGEETAPKTSTGRRRKREYSRLVMIYEEDAPIPPPDDGPTYKCF